jgi:hypothetical protein
MVSRISHTTIDCHDAYGLSSWWKPILGYTDLPGDPNEPGHEECMLVDPKTGHRLLFIEVQDAALPAKRMHLDLRPTDRTRDEEVSRVVSLGAVVVADKRNADGTGWVVLADPEGNVFCVLRSDAESTQQPSRHFVDANLSGARFVRCYFEGAVFRGVALPGVSIDGEFDALTINGVDVAPYIESELNRRFPGRELRNGTTAAELRNAWKHIVAAWRTALIRAQTLPHELLDTNVDGEWSFVQTLRHLVLATDVWLRGAIFGIEQPYHPIGQPFAEYIADGLDMSPFTEPNPDLSRVLQVRAERQALVAEFLEQVSEAELDTMRTNPWAPDHSMTVRECIGVILNEEWEHLRFALRDLDTLL